ncbi:bifunctional phosphopantothenoylcysteine decarboxylase/phosphopantothenate synthase [Vineibacter terrae]|uniref:bifunctional phosphopantothenoylcysteine decarboxylase/phosphopantothenate synthase n=1 Tax=Vineibacter terrae TaxID=2586908 RepID=UPI002E2F505F|nr:bifunctional phosphopantothenoylcysteine decarboxylase/phosphopantothenate synthase [Vineibacter terrae]HEX2889659.1 bifunctional phosphopantothenoylcysteine decarboxylase/phosphopantothenate synthase [Vineibacter terrae]
MLTGKRILLIITGGIAAFKCHDLVRRLRQRGAFVRCVMTEAATRFVTPLSLQALSEDKVYADMFSLTDESEMGHIELSREADLLVVAPATANILAKMAAGLADDLASTVLLATDKAVLAAPAMNVRMWLHAATQANVMTLRSRGVLFVGPNEGPMACNEFGPGRMSEPLEIVAAIEAFFTGLLPAPDAHAALPLPPEAISLPHQPLLGHRVLVTSGPTREAIDPVRYISNHSSGRQGHAIAAALAQLGADVTLVSGPVSQLDPAGVRVVKVESADQMLNACQAALPVDVAICAAAVADWKLARLAGSKLKKSPGAPPPSLELVPNPDILATLSAAGDSRPRLVVGFAAETEEVVANAVAKRARKGCDWILANDVSPASGTFGGENNTIHLVTADGVEDWPTQSKDAVAARLAARIAQHLTAI